MNAAPGTLIGDRYRVVRVVGSGNVGCVYEVEHLNLKAAFALKVLTPKLVVVPEAVERFAREARVMAQLDDPRIVRVTDFGFHCDYPFLVMELLHGKTLGRAAVDLHPRGRVELMLEVLAGLSAAHRRGVIHRDLKPDNIYVLPSLGRPMVKLLDFGLAKAAEPTDDLKTADGAVFGTPRYMSPEQGAGSSADERSDLYSVGVMLFELLSGSPPFVGENASEVLKKHIVEPVPSFQVEQSLTGLDVSQLRDVIYWALEKSPGDRPESADVFRSALAEACVDPSWRAGASYRPLVSRSTDQAQSRLGQRRRGVRAGLVVAGATLGFGGALAIDTPDSQEPTACLDPPTALVWSCVQPVAATVVSTTTVVRELPCQKDSSGPTPPPMLAVTASEVEAESLPRRFERGSALDLALLKRGAQAAQAHQRFLAQRYFRQALAEARSEDTRLLIRATDRWIRANLRTAIHSLIEVLSDAPRSKFDSVLAYLVKEAPSFRLRRRAFEGLEARDAVERIDRVSYLIEELARNGSDECRIRAWYVSRLVKELDDPRVRPILIREQSRRGGFLNLQRKGACMDLMVKSALARQANTP